MESHLFVGWSHRTTSPRSHPNPSVPTDSEPIPSIRATGPAAHEAASWEENSQRIPPYLGSGDLPYPLVNIEKAILFQWPFRNSWVDLPMKKMVIFHSYVNVFQRFKAYTKANRVISQLAMLGYPFVASLGLDPNTVWECTALNHTPVPLPKKLRLDPWGILRMPHFRCMRKFWNIRYPMEFVLNILWKSGSMWWICHGSS